jgi:hypothetical protein
MPAIKIFFILVVGILFSSCSVVDGFKAKEFSYQFQNKKEMLALKVPKGFAEEKMILDTSGGKEQYYYYDNGALLYFSKNVVNWQTENQPMIESVKDPLVGKNVFTYKGVDKDGLHWKEIRMDGFCFGYSYVPSGYLEKFETAINSIRIRN